MFDTSELERFADRAESLARRMPAESTQIERRNAAEMRVEAQRRAPYLTGALRAGIVLVGSTVVSTDEAAAPQEYGTAFHEAQPHMGPAADRQASRLYTDAERTAVRLAERL